MEETGVKRLIITIFAQSRDEALPMLDKLAEVNALPEESSIRISD
jgi:hypothetical protein